MIVRGLVIENNRGIEAGELFSENMELDIFGFACMSKSSWVNVKKCRWVIMVVIYRIGEFRRVSKVGQFLENEIESYFGK